MSCASCNIWKIQNPHLKYILLQHNIVDFEEQLLLKNEPFLAKLVNLASTPLMMGPEQLYGVIMAREPH